MIQFKRSITGYLSALFPAILPALFLTVFLAALLIVLLSSSLLLSGCAPMQPRVCLKDGQTYCITSDWAHRLTWDACYRRGLSCEDGGCWEYAAEEFQQAITLRFKDKRNVRAYGLHFLDEYFPHRELGICYFYLGKTEDALKELELSMSHTPSARAKHYLNQVRRDHLLATGEDTVSPSIQMESPSEEFLTNQTPVQIQGTVRDDRFVAAVSINHTPLFIELAQPIIPFTYSADLDEGWNTLEVTATDLVDRQDKKSIRVYLDQQGPLVIARPSWGQQAAGASAVGSSAAGAGAVGAGQITLTALIYDRSGIASFFLNGQDVPRAGVDRLWLIEETISPAAGIENIPFWAQDLAGNITRGEVSLLPRQRRPKLAMRLACSNTENLVTNLESRASETSEIREIHEIHETKKEGTGEEGIGEESTKAESTKVVSTEEDNISLDIVYPPHEEMKTYYQEIFLEGEIVAQQGIRSIELNGRELSHSKVIEEIFRENLPEYIQELRKKNQDTEARIKTAQSILQGHGSYYLNQKIPLRSGLTTFLLKVEDNSGNKRSKQFHIWKIDREEVFRSEERMRLVIIPFDVEAGSNDYQDDHLDGHQDKIDLERIRDKLFKTFVQQGRFNLSEQEKLPRGMIEEACQTGKVCSEELVQQIAESTLAEGVICGSVRKWMDGIEIKAWFQETEKGQQIIPLQDVFTPVNNEQNRELIISGLAMKFRDSFPICEGEITEVNQGGQSFYTDIGSEICEGIRAGMMYNIFVDEKELIEKARVEEVKERVSEAKVSGSKGKKRGEGKEKEKKEKKEKEKKKKVDKVGKMGKIGEVGTVEKKYQVRTR